MSIHPIQLSHHSTVFQDFSIRNLENRLRSATAKSDIDSVRVLTKEHELSGISAGFLGWVLHAASTQGYLDIVCALMECIKFGDISADRLGESLNRCSRKKFSRCCARSYEEYKI